KRAARRPLAADLYGPVARGGEGRWNGRCTIPPGRLDLGLGEEDRAGQVGAPEVRAPKVGTQEVRAAQIGAVEVGPDQVRPSQAGAMEVGAGESCPYQIGSPAILGPSGNPGAHLVAHPVQEHPDL